jgi:hypothetical protein
MVQTTLKKKKKKIRIIIYYYQWSSQNIFFSGVKLVTFFMGFMNLFVIFVEVWKLIKYFGLISVDVI